MVVAMEDLGKDIDLLFELSCFGRLLIMRNLTSEWSHTSYRYEVGVKDEYFSQRGFTMENFQSLLQRVNRLQSALDRMQDGHIICSSRFSKIPPYLRTVLVDCHTAQSPSEDLSVDSYAVVAAAALLLLLVYHYLTGYAARGGSIPYSSGSLDFRDTYIPIILFHGGYVWIKSRDVAFKGVLPRKSRDRDGNIRVRYEPRFKPSHRKDEPSQYIYVGRYDTPEEASILYQITAFCYNGQGGLLQLEDGNSVTIPPMTDSDRRLTGEQKRKCVADEARRVYKAFKAERATAAQPRELPAVGVDHTNSVSLNSADATYGAPLPVNPTHNSETGYAPCDDEDFWPSLFTNSPNDMVWETDFVNSLEEGVDAVVAQAFMVSSAFQEGVTASNTQSGMSFSSENELVLLRILVQEVISLQRQQLQELSEARHEHQQLKIQVTQLQNHQCFQALEPQDFGVQHFQPFQDQLQGIEQGWPSSQASVGPSFSPARESQILKEDQKRTWIGSLRGSSAVWFRSVYYPEYLFFQR